MCADAAAPLTFTLLFDGAAAALMFPAFVLLLRLLPHEELRDMLIDPDALPLAMDVGSGATEEVVFVAEEVVFVAEEVVFVADELDVLDVLFCPLIHSAKVGKV